MAENLANIFSTTLASAATAGATTISIASASGSPAANFRVRIDDEFMLVTSKGSGLDWTVTRAIEGSVAAAHAMNAVVTHVLTAGGLAQYVTDALVAYQPLDADLTAVAALSGTGYLKRTGVATWALAAAVAWADISSTPTSVAGYGITDVYTKTAADARYAPLSHSHAWGDVTGTPTTLSGYGITDAQPLDADLTAAAALSTTGYVQRTGAGTWATTATVAWSDLSSVPTTVAGYGISDVYTKTAADARYAALSHTHAWSDVTGTPTTLSGYGITDAQALDADLTAIAALSTTGYLKRTGSNTWALSASVPWSDVSTTPTTLSGYGITDAQALDADLTAIAALASTGIAARTAANTWAQRTITGTASRVSVSNGSGAGGNPTIDIDAAYVGQASITTLGTINTGVWNAGAVTSSGAVQAATTLQISTDAIFERDAADIFAQRHGTNAQTYRFYASFTDASNYTRGSLSASTTSVTLAAESAGTGSANIDVTLTPKGTGLIQASAGIKTAAGAELYFGTSKPARHTDAANFPAIWVGSSNSSVIGETTANFQGLKLQANLVRNSVLGGWTCQDTTMPAWSLGLHYNTVSTDQFYIARGPATSSVIANNLLFLIQGRGGTSAWGRTAFNGPGTLPTGTHVVYGKEDVATSIVQAMASQTANIQEWQSSTPTTLASISPAGAFASVSSVLSSGATAGVGYATGAGGTVTQLTSKSTGVTLSKICGQITMINSALAAATIVSFVVTNTAVAATDLVHVQHQSGGTLGAYSVNARAAAGSFTVDIRNNTAGSLSDAIVLSFAVFKGVTS